MYGYGTVARITPIPGKDQAVIALMNEWNRSYGPKVKGAVAGYLYQLENKPGQMIMCAVFEGKLSYRANAEDPEQDKWYRRLRALLTADPIWEDGEIVSGGPVKR